jgi:hypothetical protein
LEYRASGWDKTSNLDSNIGKLLGSARLEKPTSDVTANSPR